MSTEISKKVVYLVAKQHSSYLLVSNFTEITTTHLKSTEKFKFCPFLSSRAKSTDYIAMEKYFGISKKYLFTHTLKINFMKFIGPLIL